MRRPLVVLSVIGSAATVVAMLGLRADTWAQPADEPAATNVSVFASASPTLSTADLGRPCDANFRPIRGAAGAPLYEQQKGTTGGSRGMVAEFLEATDTRALQANAEGWGVASGSIGTMKSKRYLVYRASQQSDVLRVNDAADPQREPPADAKWYIASIFVGRSYEIVVQGDKEKFYGSVGAKLKVFSGSLDGFEQKERIQWSARGRGLEADGDKAIFATSLQDINQAYKQSADPVPIYVEYRNIPGRSVATPERLEWVAEPVPDNVKIESTPVACGCTTGHNIAVSCRVRNLGARSMDVTVGATAKTQSWSMSAAGNGRLTIAPGKVADVTVLAHIGKAMMDCSGAKDCACTLNETNPTQ